MTLANDAKVIQWSTGKYYEGLYTYSYGPRDMNNWTDLTH